MTADLLAWVSLALFDHGPLTMNAIAELTAIPLPDLRAHLITHLGERYGCSTNLDAGYPVRLWFLLAAPNQPTETHPDD